MHLSKKYIHKTFKTQNVQLNKKALGVIEKKLKDEILDMAVNCRKGNVKRLTPDLLFIAFNIH
jgi:hypothetical protein|tara:strand:+ start:145 stop:333 length:189 start_codon:yes stop_codon:yes gene_type:complete